MKRKQGTFSREITEVLAYYYAVARALTERSKKPAHARLLEAARFCVSFRRPCTYH